MVIDPSNFVRGVDNPYFPLTPGTTLVYEGISDEGTERTEDTVTLDTKDILGVTCIVVHSTVTLDGNLIEDTLDWYAQDAQGNVWYFGEDTREYENGQVTSTSGSWQAGVDGAQPGIIMPSSPQIGATYRQEYFKGEAEDMAEVVSLSEAATVAYGSFQDLLLTREWTPLEPSIVENKYYARGMGLVLEVIVEGGSGHVELVEVITQ